MILPTSVSSAIWEERAIKWRTLRVRPATVTVPRNTRGSFPNDTLLWVRPGPETVSHSWPAIAAQTAPMSTSFPITETRWQTPDASLFSAGSPMNRSIATRILVFVSLSCFSNSNQPKRSCAFFMGIRLPARGAIPHKPDKPLRLGRLLGEPGLIRACPSPRWRTRRKAPARNVPAPG